MSTETKQKIHKNWDILKTIAILKEADNGWKQEINLVSWHGSEPKYDIRWWSVDRTRCGKGATIDPIEFHLLREVISDLPQDLHLQV